MSNKEITEVAAETAEKIDLKEVGKDGLLIVVGALAAAKVVDLLKKPVGKVTSKIKTKIDSRKAAEAINVKD